MQHGFHEAAIYFGKSEMRLTKGMLWVNRVGNRRSQTILTRNFSVKTGDTPHKKKKRTKKKETEACGN
jgi:hypothetical protein